MGAAVGLLRCELVRFESLMDELLGPQLRYIERDELALYTGGKRLRPILLLLSAKASQPEGESAEWSDRVIRAAVALEALHVATLIHDDIVDEATLRRGATTLNAAHGIRHAVLMGDLQFVQAVRCFAACVETSGDMALVRRVLDVGFDLCCGELEELRDVRERDWRELESRYYYTSCCKTAELFALACECGGALVDARTRHVAMLERFGRGFGLGFQIMDDVADISCGAAEVGKDVAVDLARRRLSLPVIYALAEPRSHPNVCRLFERSHSVPEPSTLTRALRELRAGNALVRAYSKARESIFGAVEYLEHLPESAARAALFDIAEDVVR